MTQDAAKSDEIWKPVVGSEATHEVSNLGRVRTLDRTFLQGGRGRRTVMRTIPSYIKKQGLNWAGYPYVCVCEGGGRYRVRLTHRLAALSFLGPPPTADHQVNHIDGDKANNRIENLEWTTPKENSQHAYDTGLHKPINGARINTTKLDEEQVRAIRLAGAAGRSQRNIAAEYGVGHANVRAILDRRTWKHVE